MPDWTQSMQQTFEYYVVDPDTWEDKERINYVKSSTIERDISVETLGSATIDLAESIEEQYIRIYLVTIQNRITEKHSLGTFLVQTSPSAFDGKMQTISADAYTPLLELKEKLPPIGYYISKKQNIISNAYNLTWSNVRAPVVKTTYSKKLYDDFVAMTEDTWLSFLWDLLDKAKYEFALDDRSRILFSPKRDTASLQPVWTYTDDNSSILQPSISMNRDLYGIPNVVEVIYSSGARTIKARAVNDDPDSPISTVSRGREIPHRVTDPHLIEEPSEAAVEDYAKQLLRDMSAVECTIKYTHGYCPVRLGDCVRLDYTRAGLTDIKAKVISQSIKCVPGCPVSETAVFTQRLWG